LENLAKIGSDWFRYAGPKQVLHISGYICAMAVKQLDLISFLEKAADLPVFDVRSPSEFDHAHIPGAISLPLFSDAERKEVGTRYKQISKKEAIKTGLDYFGPKMSGIVKQVEEIITQRKNQDAILVHCWRGGMRSGAIAWLLDLYGFQVFTLKGGYKAFRTWVLEQLGKQFPFRVLGGFTGSGKTEILHCLKQLGETVIDLEGLAGHKGSAFGNLGLEPQGSVEFFENKLALDLLKAEAFKVENNRKWIWIEAESQRIGQVFMPNSFFEQLHRTPTLFLDIPFEERLKFIVGQYGKFEKDKLMAGVYRIRKRLGGLETRNAINFLLEDQVAEAFRILLSYYDRLYNKSTFQTREEVERIALPSTDHTTNAKLILERIHATN